VIANGAGTGFAHKVDKPSTRSSGFIVGEGNPSPYGGHHVRGGLGQARLRLWRALLCALNEVGLRPQKHIIIYIVLSM